MASYTDVASARKGFPVTPSDTESFPATRALYVGVSGDVYVDYADGGQNVKMTAAPVGERPWQVTRVYETGTTATDMVTLY